MEQRKIKDNKFHSESIHTFLVVVDQAGFGKAARAIGVSQSAVSQQIARLEETLGRKLFSRCASGIALNADGEEFLVYARLMARLTDAERKHFRDDASEKSRADCGPPPYDP